MATTPWVAGLYADLFAYKNSDARAIFPQLEDEQTRTVLIPTAPRMEWDEPQRCQLNRDARANWATAEIDTGLRPIIPARAWDDWDWSRDYSLTYAKPPEGEPFDFARAIVTPLAYDESGGFFPGGAGSLAVMLVMDEFVNAPSGSITFGPAPTGRSVRFGFSISAFR